MNINYLIKNSTSFESLNKTINVIFTKKNVKYLEGTLIKIGDEDIEISTIRDKILELYDQGTQKGMKSWDYTNLASILLSLKDPNLELSEIRVIFHRIFGENLQIKAIETECINQIKKFHIQETKLATPPNNMKLKDCATLAQLQNLMLKVKETQKKEGHHRKKIRIHYRQIEEQIYTLYKNEMSTRADSATQIALETCALIHQLKLMNPSSKVRRSGIDVLEERCIATIRNDKEQLKIIRNRYNEIAEQINEDLFTRYTIQEEQFRSGKIRINRQLLQKIEEIAVYREIFELPKLSSKQKFGIHPIPLLPDNLDKRLLKKSDLKDLSSLNESKLVEGTSQSEELRSLQISEKWITEAAESCIIKYREQLTPVDYFIIYCNPKILQSFINIEISASELIGKSLELQREIEVKLKEQITSKFIEMINAQFDTTEKVFNFVKKHYDPIGIILERHPDSGQAILAKLDSFIDHEMLNELTPSISSAFRIKKKSEWAAKIRNRLEKNAIGGLNAQEMRLFLGKASSSMHIGRLRSTASKLVRDLRDAKLKMETKPNLFHENVLNSNVQQIQNFVKILWQSRNNSFRDRDALISTSEEYFARLFLNFYLAFNEEIENKIFWETIFENSHNTYDLDLALKLHNSALSTREENGEISSETVAKEQIKFLKIFPLKKYLLENDKIFDLHTPVLETHKKLLLNMSLLLFIKSIKEHDGENMLYSVQLIDKVPHGWVKELFEELKSSGRLSKDEIEIFEHNFELTNATNNVDPPDEIETTSEVEELRSLQISEKWITEASESYIIKYREQLNPVDYFMIYCNPEILQNIINIEIPASKLKGKSLELQKEIEVALKEQITSKFIKMINDQFDTTEKVFNFVKKHYDSIGTVLEGYPKFGEAILAKLDSFIDHEMLNELTPSISSAFRIKKKSEWAAKIRNRLEKKATGGLNVQEMRLFLRKASSSKHIGRLKSTASKLVSNLRDAKLKMETKPNLFHENALNSNVQQIQNFVKILWRSRNNSFRDRDVLISTSERYFARLFLNFYLAFNEDFENKIFWETIFENSHNAYDLNLALKLHNAALQTALEPSHVVPSG
jgi:hypothetical protein